MSWIVAAAIVFVAARFITGKSSPDCQGAAWELVVTVVGVPYLLARPFRRPPDEDERL
jgi:hypothetical protein